MITTVTIKPDASGFAENKDAARLLRILNIMPALDSGDSVIIDCHLVSYATQSFVHALIGEALKKHGEQALERIEFKACSPALKSVIELVVDYSLGGFAQTSSAK